MFIMSLIKADIPNIIMQILNICVGIVLLQDNSKEKNRNENIGILSERF